MRNSQLTAICIIGAIVVLSLAIMLINTYEIGHPGLASNVDARTGEALRLALAELITGASEGKTDYKSVEQMLDESQVHGKLKPLFALGSSNCLFYPQIELWKTVSDPTSLAIVVRRHDGRFAGIRFDYSLLVTNGQFSNWARCSGK